MKLRLIILSLLIAAMSCLTSCTEESPVGSIDDETIELKWLGYPQNPNASEGTIPEKLLEEKFNVEITPIFLSQSTYNDKKAMLLASGEKIDFIYELDPVHVRQDVRQGLIAEIPYDTIKEYAPTVFAELNKECPDAWIFSRVDGSNYGIPNMNYNNEYPYIGIWRKDWLENVGIDKVPETLDEMYEALYRFTYNDPDGNGQQDTYGMSDDISHRNLFTNIFGAFGVSPINWMADQSGEPVYGGFLPGTRDALELLANWYKAGIIHPDFITDDMYSTGLEKFRNGKVGYSRYGGGFFDPMNANNIAKVTAELNEGAEVVNSPLVKGPNGDQGTFAWGKACHIIAFGAHVAEDEAKMKRLLEIQEELLVNEELLVEVRLGTLGETFEYKDASVGSTSGVNYLPPYDDNNQRLNECFAPDFGSPAFFSAVTPTYDMYLKYRDYRITDVYNEFAPKEYAIVDMFIKPDILPSSSKYFVDIRNWQINLMVEIIKGEKPIEAYDEFESYWNECGGKTLEEEAKEVVTEKATIMEELGL